MLFLMLFLVLLFFMIMRRLHNLHPLLLLGWRCAWRRWNHVLRILRLTYRHCDLEALDWNIDSVLTRWFIAICVVQVRLQVTSESVNIRDDAGCLRRCFRRGWCFLCRQGTLSHGVRKHVVNLVPHCDGGRGCGRMQDRVGVANHTLCILKFALCISQNVILF